MPSCLEVLLRLSLRLQRMRADDARSAQAFAMLRACSPKLTARGRRILYAFHGERCS